jgi:hypothetical protein
MRSIPLGQSEGSMLDLVRHIRSTCGICASPAQHSSRVCSTGLAVAQVQALRQLSFLSCSRCS